MDRITRIRVKLNVIIVQLSIIISLLIAMMLSGCASMHGLHSENAFRNTSARWQGWYEKQDNVVK